MFDLSRLLGRTFAAAADRPAWRRYLVAVFLPALAAILTLKIFGVTDAPFFPLFGLSVVLAATYGGTRPGLLAVLVTLLCNELMLNPVGSMVVSDPENWLRIAIFGVVGAVFAIVIGTSGELQRRLDLERQRLGVTLASIGDAVIATDTQSCVTFMNAVAEEATGWKLEAAQGRHLEEVFRIVNEETRTTVASPVEKVLRTGKIVGLANHTILIRRDGSEIPIDDSAAPIKAGEQTAGVILVFRDISEAKKAQQALMRTEKLASVGRLAATIAHEINNPLESLTNLIYLIRNSNDLAAVHAFADTAQNELARAAHVSQQTLSFARQSGSRASGEVGAAVHGVASLYENRLRAKDVTLHVEADKRMAVAMGGNELRQLISNLIGNAIDAEKPGGHIEVRVATLQCRNAVRITVADTGVGIDRRDLGKLFQPFFTTKRDIGTGLGLWVSRQIVEGCGGSLKVKSKVGKGTVFMVTLPAGAIKESVAASD